MHEASVIPADPDKNVQAEDESHENDTAELHCASIYFGWIFGKICHQMNLSHQKLMIHWMLTLQFSR